MTPFLRNNASVFAFAVLGLFLVSTSCGRGVEPPDLDSAEAKLLLEQMPPRAQQRVDEIRREIAGSSDPGGQWMDLAMTLHANGQPALAVDAYRMALESRPGDAEGTYLLGHALRSSGATDEARQQLAGLLAAGTDYAPAYRTLATWALEEGDLEGARQAAEQVFRIAPDGSGVRAILGKIEMAEGNHAAARDILAGGGGLVEGRDYLDFLAARAAQAAGGGEGGTTLVSEPAWSDPWLAELELHRIGSEEILRDAQVALERGEPQTAIELLEPTLRWQPDNPRVTQVLALAYRSQGNYAPAMELLEKAIESQPLVAEYYIHLAATRLAAGLATGDGALVEGAKEAAFRVREMLPDDWRGLAIVGDVLNGAGESEGALMAYRECSALAPRSIARCEAKSARILIVLGRRTEAANLLVEAFGSEPEAGEVADLLALARRTTAGDPE